MKAMKAMKAPMKVRAMKAMKARKKAMKAPMKVKAKAAAAPKKVMPKPPPRSKGGEGKAKVKAPPLVKAKAKAKAKAPPPGEGATTTSSSDEEDTKKGLHKYQSPPKKAAVYRPRHTKNQPCWLEMKHCVKKLLNEQRHTLRKKFKLDILTDMMFDDMLHRQVNVFQHHEIQHLKMPWEKIFKTLKKVPVAVCNAGATSSTLKSQLKFFAALTTGEGNFRSQLRTIFSTVNVLQSQLKFIATLAIEEVHAVEGNSKFRSQLSTHLKPLEDSQAMEDDLADLEGCGQVVLPSCGILSLGVDKSQLKAISEDSKA